MGNLIFRGKKKIKKNKNYIKWSWTYQNLNLLYEIDENFILKLSNKVN